MDCLVLPWVLDGWVSGYLVIHPCKKAQVDRVALRPAPKESMKGDSSFMKNTFLARYLGLALSLVLVFQGTVPFAVQAADSEWVLESGDFFSDGVDVQDLNQDQDQDQDQDQNQGVVVITPGETDSPLVLPNGDPEPGGGSEIYQDDGDAPVDEIVRPPQEDSYEHLFPTMPPEPTQAPYQEDPGIGLIEDPTPTPLPVLWEDPTATPGPAWDDPGELTPTPIVIGLTPTPTPDGFSSGQPGSDQGFTSNLLTPSPTPTVTPLVTSVVSITTNMVSNLHAGKEFYLNSLKSAYALSFSDDFAQIMDNIEYEYLMANGLIRADGTRGASQPAGDSDLLVSATAAVGSPVAMASSASANPFVPTNVDPSAWGSVVTLDHDGWDTALQDINSWDTGTSNVSLDAFSTTNADALTASVGSATAGDVSIGLEAFDTSGGVNAFDNPVASPVVLDMGGFDTAGFDMNAGSSFSGASPDINASLAAQTAETGAVAPVVSFVSDPTLTGLAPDVSVSASEEAGFTSGLNNTFADALHAPAGLLARNWQDVLAIYVYQQAKLGRTEFVLNGSAKKDLAAIFAELNPIVYEDKEPTYANLHVNYYVREHDIPKWDRALLKKYTETDCKLLCATVTAAKGFIRQSVGDNVTEERVNVIAAAYSLVGKVGYFWGGKSTVIGEDPRWGTVMQVTSDGSGTTGTLRAYGLDCSGFVTWAVINGYQNQAMRSLVGDGTTDQWNMARVVSEAGAQPGDFVFQAGPEAGANNHVGILVGKTDAGDWIAVHCSSGQNGVTVGEAYSASFRYIREPSFYPAKSMQLAPSGVENIDDIIVPADLGMSGISLVAYGTEPTAQVGGLEPSDAFTSSLSAAETVVHDRGGVQTYQNEDFMDIVFFDRPESLLAQAGTGVSLSAGTLAPSSNSILFEDAVDASGLVVLDENGRSDTAACTAGDASFDSFTSYESLTAAPQVPWDQDLDQDQNQDQDQDQNPAGDEDWEIPADTSFVVLDSVGDDAYISVASSWDNEEVPVISEDDGVPVFSEGTRDQTAPVTGEGAGFTADLSEPLVTLDETGFTTAVMKEETAEAALPGLGDQPVVVLDEAPAAITDSLVGAAPVLSQETIPGETSPGQEEPLVVLDFTGETLLEGSGISGSINQALQASLGRTAGSGSYIGDEVWQRLVEEGKVTGKNPRLLALETNIANLEGGILHPAGAEVVRGEGSEGQYVVGEVVILLD